MLRLRRAVGAPPTLPPGAQKSAPAKGLDAARSRGRRRGRRVPFARLIFALRRVGFAAVTVIVGDGSISEFSTSGTPAAGREK